MCAMAQNTADCQAAPNFLENLQCEVRPKPRSVGMPHEGVIIFEGGIIGFLCRDLEGAQIYT